ncbi:MAG: hypothetical protein RBS43_07495, partial [Candidatus Cloacimonas sp.]|nr:hypothetical protein [Candidatus Cloacimonas sp.]
MEGFGVAAIRQLFALTYSFADCAISSAIYALSSNITPAFGKTKSNSLGYLNHAWSVFDLYFCTTNSTEKQ